MIDLPLNYARVLYDMNIDPENLNTARSLLTDCLLYTSRCV